MGIEEEAVPKIVVVEPKPGKGILSAALDLLERAVISLTGHSGKPNYYLSENFGPVLEETPPSGDLKIRGALPECLNGEFVRVGPNPRHSPVAEYHWFDGDGIIHGVRIKDGKASYVSRYVTTSRFKQEEFFGRARFAKLGDMKGVFGLFMIYMNELQGKLKILEFSYGRGAANTALVYHHGRLLALYEADKPYVVRVLEDGDLQTIGLLDYDKRLVHNFTAHPKVDPFTDEMFTFGYAGQLPYVTYRVVTKEGRMLDPVPITIPEPVMMHDFAITENYAIFMDLPLYFRPKDMVKDGTFLFRFDPTRKAKFGVLPRYAKDELQIKWFELPSCFIFHNANAWEEGEEVVLITCRIENPTLVMILDDVKNELYEMRFNMKSGAATQRQLSISIVDFPRINESFIGRKQRYVYAAMFHSRTRIKGIVKFDLQLEPKFDEDTELKLGGNVVGIFELGPGRFGSEAVFVPRQHGVSSDEDDGYLIFFVYDESTGKSEVTVLDAKTLSPDPVAVVELPKRVPYGFHGIFMSERVNPFSPESTLTATVRGE
ncbi:carotenoid 9,10(9',10')-cleavage dioxygenase-like [Wolffia australiana]